jgi:hypothetical protein
MTQNFGRSGSLLVSQKLVIHDDTPKKMAAELSETLRYIFPETYRSDILSQDVQRIHVLSKGKSLTVIDGKTVDGYENRYDRYKYLLLFRSRTLLQNRLPLTGVDVTVSSIGRFKGKPAYVIGAQYPDETVPQIWVNKDTFRPFRWIIVSKAEGSPEDSLEVHYLKWRKVDKIWYPMRIEFFRNNTLVREILVQNVKVNPSLPEELFNIEHIKSTYPPVAASMLDQGETDGLNEVQKTIEEFKKIYE